MSSILLLGLGREAKSSWRYIQSQSDLASVVGKSLDGTHATKDTVEIWLADELPEDALDTFWKMRIAEKEVAGYLKLGEDKKNGQKNDQKQDQQTKELRHFDVIIRSPGIPIKKLAQNYNITADTLTSNTQLFFDWLGRHPEHKIMTIGVTGTKGKSTTTAMIHAALVETAGPDVTFLGGNIGIPALSLIEKIKPLETQETLYVVLELSCHQLSDLNTSPDIAVVQNITPEHLDYYDTVQEYVASKSSICKFQTNRNTVFYVKASERKSSTTAKSNTLELESGASEITEHVWNIARQGQGEKIAFSLETLAELEEKTGQILLRDWKSGTPESLRIVGSHNVINAIPALLISQHLGFDVKQAAKAVRSFAGLPYRLQHVVTHEHVAFYNDSLATTPESAAAAIASFPKGTVILLAGGHDRHVSFAPLAHAVVKYSVRAVILFPPIGHKIKAAIEQQLKKTNNAQTITYVEVDAMKPAVKAAFKLALQVIPQTGVAAVLLSPGAPSFGIFKDYQDRGDQFVKEAQDVIIGK